MLFFHIKQIPFNEIFKWGAGEICDIDLHNYPCHRIILPKELRTSIVCYLCPNQRISSVILALAELGYAKR